MSTMRRVYLPLTQQQLESLLQDRELAGERLSGFGVTQAARGEQPGLDDDELHEFGAAQDAARAALAGEGRVVAAADVVETGIRESASGSELSVPGPLPLKRFASFHLIDRSSVQDDPDAEVELSWFDATELELLLDLLRAQ